MRWDVIDDHLDLRMMHFMCKLHIHLSDCLLRELIHYLKWQRLYAMCYVKTKSSVAEKLLTSYTLMLIMMSIKIDHSSTSTREYFILLDDTELIALLENCLVSILFSSFWGST